MANEKNSFSESYAKAGVDVTAGYKAVELMKRHVARTVTEGSIDSIGGFGGLFLPNLSGMEEPVLVSGTDGVGTKLKIAMLMDRHDTIGIDCVAMCVNDVICCGAKPLFFLDYIACGKNFPEKIAEIVGGVAEGCVQAGCALIGGETAEHPGMMPEDDYDLAGFTVGIADRKKLLKPDTQKAGDVLIAIASSGVHSNGFSLVRKVFDMTEASLAKRYDELGMTLGECLLTPTRIYVRPVLSLLESVNVKAISHITGGGFYENIPRALPDGISAHIKRRDVRVLPIFDLLAQTGKIPERDMFNTYNMGVGMIVSVAAEDADKAVSVLNAAGETAYVLGELVSSEEGVIIE
ncbi:MAG: phosphoribosylformylglycinamidine cyclo-ligase [Oscillospiraceae bacterium]|nr:phosphoribosylformylglycinamidine cyclo-ligase [Oscillospiraceae bacterium]